MFGFGNRNKNKEAEAGLEMITMETALRGASVEEFFGKSPSPKNQASQTRTPEIKIPRQSEKPAEENEGPLFKQTSSEPKEPAGTSQKTASPFLGSEDDQFLAPDSINKRTIKPQKVQIQLEKNVPKEKTSDLEEKQEFLLENILRKRNSPEQEIPVHKFREKEVVQHEEPSIGNVAQKKISSKKKDENAENQPLRQKESFIDKISAKKQEPPAYKVTDKNKLPKRKLSIDEILERKTSPKQDLLINRLLKQQNPSKKDSVVSSKKTPSPFAEPKKDNEKIKNEQITQTTKKGFDISVKKDDEPSNQRQKPILKEDPETKEDGAKESYSSYQNTSQQQGSLSSELETRNSKKETATQAEPAKLPPAKLDSRIHPDRKYSKPLLFIAFLLLLSTIASGAYYYFFVIKQTQSGWSPIKIPSILEQNNKAQQKRKIIANVLETSTTRSLNETTFKLDFERLVVALKSDANKNQELERGIFLKLFSEKNTAYSSHKILSLLEIESEQINSVITENGWCFLSSEKATSSDKDQPVIKLSLFMELKDEMQNSQIVSAIMESEEDMPQQFLPLFIDEEKPAVPRIISFERSFTQNEIAPQTRYFNYEKGVGTKSIDWSVISDQNKSYLMISTSKSSTEKIIDQLQ